MPPAVAVHSFPAPPLPPLDEFVPMRFVPPPPPEAPLLSPVPLPAGFGVPVPLFVPVPPFCVALKFWPPVPPLTLLAPLGALPVEPPPLPPPPPAPVPASLMPNAAVFPDPP